MPTEFKRSLRVSLNPCEYDVTIRKLTKPFEGRWTGDYLTLPLFWFGEALVNFGLSHGL